MDDWFKTQPPAIQDEHKRMHQYIAGLCNPEFRDFRDSLDAVVLMLTPLEILLRLTDSNEPTLHLFFGALVEACATISSATLHGRFEPARKEILDIISMHAHRTPRYLNRAFDKFPKHGLKNYLVLAAALASPASVYRDSILEIPNGYDSFFIVAKRLHAGKGFRGLPDCPWEGESGVREKLTKQLNAFRNRKGIFGGEALQQAGNAAARKGQAGSAFSTCNDPRAAAVFWELALDIGGSAVAEICFVALELVTKVSSSGAAERIFRMLGLIVTKPRNALEEARIESLLIIRMGMGAEEAKRRMDIGKLAFPPMRTRSTIQMFRDDLVERAAAAARSLSASEFDEFWDNMDFTLDTTPLPSVTENALGEAVDAGIREVDARDWEQFAGDIFGPEAVSAPDPVLLAMLNEVAANFPLPDDASAGGEEASGSGGQGEGDIEYLTVV